MVIDFTVKYPILYKIREDFIKCYPTFFEAWYPKFENHNIDDIFDKSVIEKNGWFMYVSKKPDEQFAWLVTHKLYVEGENVKSIELLRNGNWINTLSIRGFVHEDQFELREECEYTELGLQVIEAAKNDFIPKTPSVISKSPSEMSSPINNHAHSDYNIAKILTQHLSSERADKYEQWIQLGWCLHNIENSERMMNVWIDFSKKCPNKFDEDECINKWATMRNDGLKLGTLFKWVQKDNPDEYKNIIKDISFTFKTSATIDEVKMSKIVHDYEVVKDIFEKTVFKVDNPCGYCVEENDGTLTLLSANNFKERFRDVTTRIKIEKKRGDVEFKHVKFINVWLDDGAKRKYTKIDFIPPPLVCEHDCYNLWKGFTIDNIAAESSGNIDPFIRHAKIIVGHKDHDFNYLMWFLAQMIQEPGSLIGIALVFISKEGAGKNRFWDLITDMIGSIYAFETANPEKDLFGRFSNGRKNKLLINIDETKSKDTFANADFLKNIITSPVFNYEAKNVDPVVMKNFARFIFTTNNTICLKITDETRRYVVFECSNEMVGNSEYFNEFSAYMKNVQNQKAIIEYLRKVDYSKVNWIKDRPMSDAYNAMRSYCSDPVHKFLADIWQRNRSKEVYQVQASKLLDDYVSYLTREQYSNEFIRGQKVVNFGKVLTGMIKIGDTGITKGKDAKRCSAYIFNIKILNTYLTKIGVITEQTYMFLD